MYIKKQEIWEKVPIKMQVEILDTLTNICMEIAYESKFIYIKHPSYQKSHYLCSSVHDATGIGTQRESEITV